MSQKPFKILGIEHVGIAVESLDDLSNVFSDVLGLEFAGSEEVKNQQVITEIYETGRGKLEFLKATDMDSPIAQFLDKKGEGIHHISLIVDNLQLALNSLSHQGMRLIDYEPRNGADGYKIAFLHPKSTCGILVELCQKKDEPS